MARINMAGQETTGRETPFGLTIYLVGNHGSVIENYGLSCHDCNDGMGYSSIEALEAVSCQDRSQPYVEDTTALTLASEALHRYQAGHRDEDTEAYGRKMAGSKGSQGESYFDEEG